MRLPCNVGPRERYLRLGLAAVAGGAALSRRRSPAARLLLGTVALAGMVTASTRYCPINAALGLANCR